MQEAYDTLGVRPENFTERLFPKSVAAIFLSFFPVDRRARAEIELGRGSQPQSLLASSSISYTALMDAAEAKDRLAEIQYRSLQSFVVMRAFLTVSANGFAVSRKVFYEQAYSLPEQLESADWFIPDKTKLTPDFREKLANSLSEGRTLDAQSFREALALVFAHSTVDATATDLCNLIASVAPKAWESDVGGKEVKLTLRDWRNSSYDVLLQSALQKHMKAVAKKSLLNRVKLINEKCQPVPKMNFDGQLYTLDLSRLKAFDERRHNIVHRLDLKTNGQDLEQELSYWETTCLYLSNMVAHKYNLQFDLDAIRRAALKRAQSS